MRLDAAWHALVEPHFARLVPCFVVALYDIVHKASEICEAAGAPVKSTIVLQRLPEETMSIKLVGGRDEWWHEAVPAAGTSCPVEWMDSEAPLFVLYTSG